MCVIPSLIPYRVKTEPAPALGPKKEGWAGGLPEESAALLAGAMVAGGGPEPSERTAPWQIALAFFVYAVLNLFLNFFNKWALAPSGAGFSLPVFYSTWHMLMSIVGSYVLMLIRKPATGMVSFEQFKGYKWESLTLSVCTTVNISCNNASLMLIGLFVNQASRAIGTHRRTRSH